MSKTLSQTNRSSALAVRDREPLRFESTSFGKVALDETGLDSRKETLPSCPEELRAVLREPDTSVVLGGVDFNAMRGQTHEVSDLIHFARPLAIIHGPKDGDKLEGTTRFKIERITRRTIFLPREALVVLPDGEGVQGELARGLGAYPHVKAFRAKEYAGVMEYARTHPKSLVVDVVPAFRVFDHTITSPIGQSAANGIGGRVLTLNRLSELGSELSLLSRLLNTLNEDPVKGEDKLNLRSVLALSQNERGVCHRSPPLPLDEIVYYQNGAVLNPPGALMPKKPGELLTPEILAQRGKALLTSLWSNTAGFLKKYDPQELSRRIATPGGCAVYLETHEVLLGYLTQLTDESNWPERAKLLKASLAISGKEPNGKKAALNLVQLTPFGRLVGRIGHLSIYDLMHEGALEVAKRQGVSHFICECRGLPFPNESGLAAHKERGWKESGAVVISSYGHDEKHPKLNAAHVLTLDVAQSREIMKERARDNAAGVTKAKKARSGVGVINVLAEGDAPALLEAARDSKKLLRLSPAQFTLLVDHLVKAHFAPDERQDYILDKKQNDRYFDYSATFFAKSGMLSGKMVADLMDGACMLDVGAGACHLERLLVMGFGIKPSQISVADKKLYDLARNLGVETIEFDMGQPWPKLARKFDYVVFGESINMGAFGEECIKETGKGTRGSPTSRTYRFSNELNEVEQGILCGEMDSIPKSKLDFFMHLIELDTHRPRYVFDVVSKAIDWVKPEGEIRVRGLGLSDQGVAYNVAKLDMVFPGVEFLKADSDTCFLRIPNGLKKHPENEATARSGTPMDRFAEAGVVGVL